MKKLVSLMIISLCLVSTTFGYNLNTSERKMVDNFVMKVQKSNLSEKKLDVLIQRLGTLEKKYSKNVKISTLLSEILIGVETIKETKKVVDTPKETTYKVLKVVDGDTIRVMYDGKDTSVRILGLDTPEKFTTRTGSKECYGDEASYFAFQELGNKEVILEFDPTQDKVDRYGRLLAHVFYYNDKGEKVFFQEKMIREGYGFYYLYKKPVTYADILIQAENKAKEAGKGLWGACNGERTPVEQVKQETSDKVETIVQNDAPVSNNNDNTGSVDTSLTLLSQSQWQWDSQAQTYYRTSRYEDNSKNQVYFKKYTKDDFPTNFTCEVRKTCTQMTSCQEALFHLHICGNSNLDRDKNMIPCESKCPTYTEVRTIRETADRPTTD